MKRDYSHRIGKKKVHVVGKDGAPIVGKPLQVEMLRHEFLFGSDMSGAVPYASGAMTDPEKCANFESIFEKWSALMNNATLHFYWSIFEPEKGKTISEQVMKGAEFLKEHGVVIKGHPLCWHTLCPEWLLQYGNEKIITEQVTRIQREVAYFRDVIDMWDVINEVVIMPVFDRYDNAVTRMCRQLGRVKTIKTMFDAARESNPDATLLINDFNLSSNYQILIDGCLNSGVSIDAIGLQTHQHQGYMGEERLLEVLERFSVFGKPLHFTEITLTSGHLMPAEIVDLNDYQIDEWPTTPAFEERQARELKEMYEILFAHPLVKTAYSWNFMDGGWLDAPAGLLRKDGSKKPAYDALYELIRKEWWTPSQEWITDEKGGVTIEGFRGTYLLHCCGDETTLKVDDDSAAVVTFTLH